MAVVKGNCISGKVGDLVFYEVGGKQYVRKHVGFLRDRRSEKQLAQRRRFGELGRLAGELGEALKAGMPGVQPRMRRARFVSLNMGALVEAGEGQVRVVRERLRFSEDGMPAPEMRVELDEAEGRVRFCFEEELYKRYGGVYEEVFAVVYGKGVGELCVFPLVMRTGKCVQEWRLPGSKRWEEVLVYVTGGGVRTECCVPVRINFDGNTVRTG